MAILRDPGAADLVAALAQPVAKTGQVVVEEDRIGLAGRQHQRRDGRFGELHGVLSGSGWEAGGCFILTIRD
jgi:hypothetical protein